MSRNELIKKAHEVFAGDYVNNCILYAIEGGEKHCRGGKVIAFITSPESHQGIVFTRPLKSFDCEMTIAVFIDANVDSIHEYNMGELKPSQDFAEFVQCLQQPLPILT